MKVIRKLIHIDEDLCNGCGQCVPGCAEGALQIIDGKARLVAERYCDGLGACLGECPTGALTVREVETEDFDPEAVTKQLQAEGRPVPDHMPSPEELRLRPAARSGGCPGSRVMSFQPAAQTARTNESSTPSGESARLSHWPVQLHLVPPTAPFLQGADLLLAADCVPPAYPAFHSDLLPGRVLLLGCPKFDDVAAYERKLTEIFSLNDVKSVIIAEMEVPCCSNMSRLVARAAAASGKDIPLVRAIIGRDGTVLSRERLNAAPAAATLNTL